MMSVLFGEYLSRCVRDFRQSSPPSLRISNALNVSCSSKTVGDDFTACHRLRTVMFVGGEIPQSRPTVLNKGKANLQITIQTNFDSTKNF